MLLNYMHRDPILEQQFGGMPNEMVDPDENADPAFPEATPLKKFDLLQKITFMRNALREQNIYDDDLDLIIQFGTELSYETLLMLTNAIVDKINKHLTEIGNDKKSREESEQ